MSFLKDMQLKPYQTLNLIRSIMPKTIQPRYCGKFTGNFDSYVNKRLFIDINVYYEFFANSYAPCQYSYAEPLLEIFEAAWNGDCTIVSTISQLEVLARVLFNFQCSNELKLEFLSGLRKIAKIEELYSWQTFHSTEEISRKYNIDPEDASMLAQAKSTSADIFVTRDFSSFDHKTMEGIRVICPERIYGKFAFKNIPICRECLEKTKKYF